MHGIIQIENLTKFYGAQKGVENLNLSIPEGEIFGFIGPNGAGKSTTIRCLLALIYPTSGSAKIMGKDAIQCAPELAQSIGYLPSEVFYYDNMRVRDLLQYAASFYKRDCTKRIQQLCDVLELDPSRKIDDLSFGNRKKVGIVQGLLHSPKLIFLDEPTSGLDPLMQNRFFELIRQENQNGATIFFSSHILSEVQRMCHRVGFIKQGAIIRLETMAKLREHSYTKVFLECNAPIDAGDLGLPDGVVQAHDGARIGFVFKGNLPELLGRLARLPLSDVSITEPDLEEIFLHDYL
jgi:ABC-2 type transport system ATP-binding protein